MPADAYVMDADMKKVADAIRAKTGKFDSLVFPDGMVTAIGNIPSGGSCGPDLTTDVLKMFTNIPESGFADNQDLAVFSSPYITTIGGFAFVYCMTLTTVNLPSATSIGESAFDSCEALTTIDLPSATSIGEYAFYYCMTLTTVNLPSATSIGESAFNGCEALTTIDLPSATSIGESAFVYCEKLTTLILRSTEVATAGLDVLDVADLAKVYVPDNLVDQYKVATNWSQYADRILPISQLPQ